MESTAPTVPADSGKLDGIAWCLWLPEGDLDGPLPAVIVLHGAGSQKENHADFARKAAAQGFAALTFDNRGHGETEGSMNAGVVDDLRAIARFLAERPEVDGSKIAARGSSMGGLMALHLGAASDDVAAVIAICPAAENAMLPQIKHVAEGNPAPPDSYLSSMRVDAAGLVGWLESNDVFDAVQQLGSKPLLLIHAKGDEVVPYERSEEMYELAQEPKKLWVLEGGDHRSAQHDEEIQGESLRWLTGAL